MANFTIRQYSGADKDKWNSFVATACNATFLFDRNFMDYHRDRFSDYSLIILQDDVWQAVLPSHLVDDELYSHYGLTYGGLVYNSKMKLVHVVEILQLILQFLHNKGIKKLHVKTIPSIYQIRPAGEFDFALIRAKAIITRRDALAVIDLREKLHIKKTRKESIRRGIRERLAIKEETYFDAFWNDILIPNLQLRHQAKPVHSLEEIKLLQNQFPEKIRHFNVYDKNRLVAGTTVFVSDRVAHPQYLAGQEERSMLGSIDFLYHHLITSVFADKPFFDFGISQENNGLQVNVGLSFWKESFGAGTVVQDFYSVESANFDLLDDFKA
jgi:hypothetical protein